MSKSNRNTSTNRRGSRPIRAQRPYKPIPVITEQHRGKAKIDEKAKQSLVARLKEWGRRIRRLFGRKKRRRIESKTIKGKWRRENTPQEITDLARHKAKIKARNRRKRKAARALHQMERRRA